MRDDFPELSARARRGTLPEPEQRQLRLLLAGSLEARLTHRAGCEFDEEDSVLPGEDALAARVTARLLAPPRPATPSRRRLAWRLVPAAALAVAAAAAGPTLVERLGESSGPEPGGPAVVAPPREPAAAPRAARVTARAATPAGSTPMTASSAAAPPTAPPPPTPTRGGAVASTSVGDGPAELFAAASRARREGQTARALALYQELERRHPATAEAHAADIALGMLYADAAPAQALAHFRRYLAQGGPLAPEALWGQARALSALGRTEEAQQSWRALITRYPRSAYANAARTRLASDP